jgi:hypothetical protein
MRFIPNTMKFAGAPRDTSSKARPSAVRCVTHVYPSARVYLAQRRAVGPFRRSRPSAGPHVPCVCVPRCALLQVPSKHLHRDWARPCRYLHWRWARPFHICTATAQ